MEIQKIKKKSIGVIIESTNFNLIIIGSISGTGIVIQAYVTQIRSYLPALLYYKMIL